MTSLIRRHRVLVAALAAALGWGSASAQNVLP
jgi:hypothetical protein